MSTPISHANSPGSAWGGAAFRTVRAWPHCDEMPPTRPVARSLLKNGETISALDQSVGVEENYVLAVLRTVLGMPIRLQFRRAVEGNLMSVFMD
eukprot:1190559-Prorocentrum_minimum.AAC.2